MKLWKLTLPVGLIIAGFGAYLGLSGGRAQSQPTAPVRHYVTPAMEASALGWSQKLVPLELATLTTAQKFQLKEALAKGPLFVYFVKDGCPCSVDAEPLFQRLYKKWGTKVQFLTVIDQGTDKAGKWASLFTPPYGVALDPDKKIIHSFQATNSAFSALVSKDGKIVKMWPGYCQQYLLEMNQLMAKQVGQEPGTFDTAYAPVEKTAGCTF